MDDLTPPPPSPLYPDSQPPKHHGCVLAWLGLIVLGSVITLILTPLAMGASAVGGYHPSVVLGIVSMVCAVANIYFAYLLFKWQKLGFLGLAGLSLVSAVINLIAGAGILPLVYAAIGIGILYGVLQIGGPTKAWNRLR